MATIEATTQEQLEALLDAQPINVRWGAELLSDVDGSLIEDITDDVVQAGGEVEYHNDYAVMSTCKFSISEELDWDHAWVRIFQVRTGAGYYKRDDLGVYALTLPETVVETTPITWDVEGQGLISLLNHIVGDSYYVPAGTGYLAAVTAAVAAAGVTGVPIYIDSTGISKTLSAPLVWAEPDTTYLDIINGLLRSVGYTRGLFEGRSGYYTAVPFQAAKEKAPTATLDVDNPAGGRQRVTAKRTRTRSVRNRQNYWTFTRINATGTPTEGNGQYTVDHSNGGYKYKDWQQVDGETQADLVANGDDIVETSERKTETIDISVGPGAIYWANDTVDYRDQATGGSRKCRVNYWRCPLKGGDIEMQLEVI